jgi:hypothetical protein
MKIFKLTPRAETLSKDNWNASTHHGVTIIRAENENRAYILAGGKFNIATPKPTPLPWHKEFVDCEEITNSNYDLTGGEKVLEVNGRKYFD